MKTIEITMLFLGSVIGAGFATGAEIITFFGKINLPNWCIAIVVGLTMFVVIGLQILLNYPQKTQSPKTNNTKGWQSKIGDVFLILIYFILFTAMTAGIMSITNISVTIISLIISICIVLFGFNQLSRLNTYIVITIIALIISLALPHLQTNTTIPHYNWQHLPANMLWGFLYAGLNCFIFPDLIKASAQHHQRKTLVWAGALTAFIITCLVGFILTTIKNTNSQTAAIPLLTASPNYVSIIVILLAILTSQYTALFAIIQRLDKIVPNKKPRPFTRIVGICVLTFLCSFLGFNQIINFAYPIIGAITCVFLLFSWLRRQ